MKAATVFVFVLQFVTSILAAHNNNAPSLRVILPSQQLQAGISLPINISPPGPKQSRNYKELVENGKKLWNMLQAELKTQNNHVDKHSPSDDDLLTAGWEVDVPDPGRFLGGTNFYKDYFPLLNADTRFYETVFDRDSSRFENAINPALGIVIATWNFNEEDVSGMRWSDFLFNALQGVSHKAGMRNLPVLKTIFRDKVSSVTGKTLASELDLANKALPSTFTPRADSEEFYAILGSENGAGIAYLLKDYMNALGRLTISAIHIHQYYPQVPNSIYIWFDLVPYDANVDAGAGANVAGHGSPLASSHTTIMATQTTPKTPPLSPITGSRKSPPLSPSSPRIPIPLPFPSWKRSLQLGSRNHGFHAEELISKRNRRAVEQVSLFPRKHDDRRISRRASRAIGSSHYR